MLTIARLLHLVYLSIAFSAIAQPYKCNIDGKIVYQQAKCIDAQSVNISGAGAANTNSPGAIQSQIEVAQYRRKLLVNSAITENKIFIGMTRDEVMQSWGSPTKINKTINSSGTSEQWVYRRGNFGNDQYLYLDNGVVRSMQSSE